MGIAKYISKVFLEYIVFYFCFQPRDFVLPKCIYISVLKKSDYCLKPLQNGCQTNLLTFEYCSYFWRTGEKFTYKVNITWASQTPGTEINAHAKVMQPSSPFSLPFP